MANNNSNGVNTMYVCVYVINIIFNQTDMFNGSSMNETQAQTDHVLHTNNDNKIIIIYQVPVNDNVDLLYHYIDYIVHCIIVATFI